MKAILIAAVILLAGCSNQDVVKTSEGTFRKIRERSALNKYGAFDIELWAKDGVPTNKYVFRRSGDTFFQMNP